MTRTVRIALCDPGGEVFGALPPFELETPWWQDTGPAVVEARRRYGVELTILRIVDTEDRWPPHGGRVTYLAEVEGPPGPLEPIAVDTADHPARARWARPGGVGEIVAWADAALAKAGRLRTGPAEQLRTWNLSLVMRLPTNVGPVWLKAAPPFMAHEGAVLALVHELDPDLGPPLLAHEPGLVLLDHVPGDDQYDAAAQTLRAMVERWVGVQAASAASLDAVVATGARDWRPATFTADVAEMLLRTDVADRFTNDDRHALDRLVATLLERFERAAACGLPDTLVHGDFHAGNWRGTDDHLVLLDWGDSGLGHPLLDRPAFLHGNTMDDTKRAAAIAGWRAAWQAVRPGSDPDGAAAVLAPVSALRQARIYRLFLDNIEPSEHRYHLHDTEDWLRRALALVEPS